MVKYAMSFVAVEYFSLKVLRSLFLSIIKCDPVV